MNDYVIFYLIGINRKVDNVKGQRGRRQKNLSVGVGFQMLKLFGKVFGGIQ